jgi:hypothetical protein
MGYMGRVNPNAMTLERFRDRYSELDCDKTYWWGGDKIFPDDIVTSIKDDIAYHKWKVIAVGALKWDKIYVLLEMPTGYVRKTGTYSQYWSYGSNEQGLNVVRRTMLARNVRLITEEEVERYPFNHQFYDQEKEQEDTPMCRCRSSYCYCDSALSYEINPHSNKVEITKGKTISVSLQEADELISYLSTARAKLKEAKLAELALQQEQLDAAKAEIQSL